MSGYSVAHGTFVVERTYDHPVEKVWAAWADGELKAQWFGAPGENNRAQVFEFRQGGRESLKTRIHDGRTIAFDVLYQDIVPNNRILYNYDMHADGRKISVSLAALEFSPQVSNRTHLRLTEYGLFLDGLDNVGLRKQGTLGLMEQLAEFLDK
ncbi:MAG TPA: SRPBCC domain-containing protein [Devosia sp.]|nr:SRPBCC domain-containing protein [Devosia sp.]